MIRPFIRRVFKMRVYKYIYSCFLVEQAGEKLLFDPGKFSFVERRVKPPVFNDVSTIVITHHHPDHVHIESLKQILAQSGARVVGNGEIAATLGEQGIEVSVLEEGTQRSDRSPYGRSSRRTSRFWHFPAPQYGVPGERACVEPR